MSMLAIQQHPRIIHDIWAIGALQYLYAEIQAYQEHLIFDSWSPYRIYSHTVH